MFGTGFSNTAFSVGVTGPGLGVAGFVGHPVGATGTWPRGWYWSGGVRFGRLNISYLRPTSILIDPQQTEHFLKLLLTLTQLTRYCLVHGPILLCYAQ